MPACVKRLAEARAAEGSSASQPGRAASGGRAVARAGIAAEGTLASGAPPFRAVVIGDGDFASNSFLPYMANSDLLVAAVRWLAREISTAAHAHPCAGR
ncbi:MAG: hypothetical protein U1E60_08895 [Reyranellaceae bacterium]